LDHFRSNYDRVFKTNTNFSCNCQAKYPSDIHVRLETTTGLLGNVQVSEEDWKGLIYKIRVYVDINNT